MQFDSTVQPAALRAEVAALGTKPCGMVHERVGSDPDGLPQRAAEGDYRRPGICSAAIRNRHLGCSHTTARLVLARVLDTLDGDDAAALRRMLQQLDGALGAIDHRRYDAESRRADAVHADDAAAAAGAEVAIQAIIAEHHALGQRVGEIRAAILLRLDQR